MSTYAYIFQPCGIVGFGNRVLHPVNGHAVEFETKRDANYIFYRTTLKTSLIFTSDDYQFLKSIDSSGNRCATDCLVIQRLCNGVWKDFWKGKFSFTYFKVNEDDCRIEFTPDINDPYTCLLEDGTIDQNILNITSKKTVHVPDNTQFEYLACAQDKNAPCLVNTNNYCGTNGLGVGTPNYGDIMCNPVSVSPPPAIAYPQNVAFDCLPDGVDQWQLYRNTTFVTFPMLVAPTHTSVWFREVRITLDVAGLAVSPAGATWIDQGPYALPSGKPAHRWTRVPYESAYYEASYYTFGFGSSCEHVWYWNHPGTTAGSNYTRGRSLKDVLEFLLDQSGCYNGNIIVSDFFRINSTLTTGDPDYVTGNPTLIDNIMIFQKQDVVDPGSSEPSDILLTNWVSFMEMLRQLFVGNLYWKIMPDGTLRIEHLKWFVKNNGLDTTTSGFEAFTKRTKKYSFLRQELPSVEHFEFMEQGNIDFIGENIVYKTLCVNKDAKSGTATTTLSNLTTDISFIQTDTASIAKEGFVFMATKPNNAGTYDLVVAPGALTGLSVLNAPLSWANLHRDYGMWGRVQPQGNMNGADVNFYSWIRTKRQDAFSIPLCCQDIDYNDLIKSQLGWGEVVSATYNTQTDNLKLQLLHY